VVCFRLLVRAKFNLKGGKNLSEKTADNFMSARARIMLKHSCDSIQYWFADPVHGFVLHIVSENGITRAYIERLQDPSLEDPEGRKI